MKTNQPAGLPLDSASTEKRTYVMTNLRPLRDLFRAARSIAAACALMTAVASAAAGQTNTFPANGNAGVGTTTPAIQSGTTNSMVEVKGTVNPGVGLTSTAAGGRQYFVYSSQTNPGYFSVFDATAGSDRFVINNLGNVGIGTASPTAPFTISTPGNTMDGSYYSTMTLRKTGDTVSGIRFDKNSTALFRLGTDSNNNFQISRLVGTGLDDGAFYLNQSGKVGIGTTSPTTALEVGRNAAGTPSGITITGGSTVAAPVLYFNYADAGTNLKRWMFFADINGGFSLATQSDTGGIASQKFFISNGGNVGIGTVSPGEKLEVTGNLRVSGTGNINAAGTIEGGNIKAKYQDVAEWVPSAKLLAAGTVVVLDTTKSNQVISSSAAYDTRVAGVISAQPGIALGESGEGKVLVATTGRVRVKVDATRGPIAIGDLLVTSDIEGVAMKSEPINLGGRMMHMPGTLIGKALEPLAKGKGEILVLLSLQ